MNPLVKKEIRLLLPSWSVAVLLAMVQGITRPYDFYVASLLFFGLALMALTTIGREASLNTFSSLLVQPMERLRIWQTKLSVLAGAFLTVFAVWLVAFGIAFITSNVDASDAENSYNLFITICLIATATFTGGLWTTLLLRQLAGAFWLTLLVPAVLSGFAGVFLAESESGSIVIAVLSVVIAVYSVAGFFFARWLFFRAQDVGWSGGIIALPEWKIFARSENAVSARNRKPIFALFKKEFQLHQVSLFGAAGLLVLHLGVIVLRTYHHFAKESAGEILTSIFWILWLVMAPVIGSMAVAEERRLGVMEGQLCLPVSRRVQFAIKGFFTLLVGTVLGGVMPMVLEGVATGTGAFNPSIWFALGIVAFAAWLTLVSFFASSLARSFLQAVGLAIATFIGSVLLSSALVNGRMYFVDYIPAHSFLPVIIAIPTVIVTLLSLAYLNFKNFRDGWPLWRRNLLGLFGALMFIGVTSAALYNRAWEIFEPAEPAHGPAKFSLASPPALHNEIYNNLLVRLPDGRVWFDYLGYAMYDHGSSQAKQLWFALCDPLPKSAGVQRFVAGSNWLAVSARHVEFYQQEGMVDVRAEKHSVGYLDTVGIKADGTLWISDESKNSVWTGDNMIRFGDGTDWRQVVRSRAGVLLLKNDGTLWRWGTNHVDWINWRKDWLSLRTYQPHQIGADAGWREIVGGLRNFARKADGSVWAVSVNDKSWQEELRRETNLDQVSFQTLSFTGGDDMAYVRPDGTLWARWQEQRNGTNADSGFVRAGTETDWKAVALTWNKMMALKSDGSLWQWNFNRRWKVVSQEDFVRLVQQPPTRLGIHNDWVALAGNWGDVVALAGDGSLWLWPDREQYEEQTLLKLPKQPQFLGNVFGKAN
jgi:hypothetical protein